MSELDHLKEEVAYLKFWLGIVVVTDISLAGWLISSSETAAVYTVFFAVVGLVLLSAGIVFLHRRIERRITRIKELSSWNSSLPSLCSVSCSSSSALPLTRHVARSSAF